MPDLRSRVPIHAGQGPGLSNYRLGQKSGVENVTLTEGQLPPHHHDVNAVAGGGNSNDPTGRTLANTGAFDNEYSDATPTVKMSSSMIANAGSGQSHTNIQPYNTVNFIIALQGTFPSRS